MLIKFTHISNHNGKWELRELYVNPDQVSSITEAKFLQKLNESGHLVDGLNTSHRFSKVTVGMDSFLIVGHPSLIRKELRINDQSYKKLLRG